MVRNAGDGVLFLGFVVGGDSLVGTQSTPPVSLSEIVRGRAGEGSTSKKKKFKKYKRAHGTVKGKKDGDILESRKRGHEEL